MGLKRTPLFPIYTKYGAKTIEFGGWEMPVQFSGILEEHLAVRERAGLFDVSHMGEIEVRGPGAAKFLQGLLTNDIERLAPGRAMYSLMTNERGGCVDDLLVYCLAKDKFWLVVNAANLDKDRAWLEQHQTSGCEIEDISARTALLALQGPRAFDILQPLCTQALQTVRPFRFVHGAVADIPVLISRTGYTGEDGFELYVEADAAVALWETLVRAGEPYGMRLCGLGCRDTLRLEARLPLYGHELSEDITPLEAGLGVFVKLDKGPFPGRDVLLLQQAAGPPRQIAGVRVTGRGIPRQGYPVYIGATPVGHVTSGTMSPTLRVPIALVLVESSCAQLGTSLEIDVRGKRVPAQVVPTPFYRRNRA